MARHGRLRLVVEMFTPFRDLIAVKTYAVRLLSSFKRRSAYFDVKR